MWSLKAQKFLSETRSGETWERAYIENQEGVRVVFDRFGTQIEDAEFTFTYEDEDLHFPFVAHMRERASSSATDCYTVELGAPLERLSRTLGPHIITVDRAHKLARDIRGALLVWRLPEPVVKILGVAPVASKVVFDLRGWDAGEAILGRDWP